MSLNYSLKKEQLEKKLSNHYDYYLSVHNFLYSLGPVQYHRKTLLGL